MRKFLKPLLFPFCLLLVFFIIIFIIVTVTHSPKIPEWLSRFMAFTFLITWGVSTLFYAKSKGYGWWGWVVAGFLFPGTYFILLFLLDRKKEVTNSIQEEFLSKQEYLDFIKDNPDLYVWKTYEEYIKNSKDGIPLVKISKEDIKETKKVLKADFEVRGMIAYNEMLRTCLENPVAVFRMQMIPGARKLQNIQNFIITINRLLIISGIILLLISIFSKSLTTAIWGIIILILDYFVSAYLQTEINFELAARLVTLDQKRAKTEGLEDLKAAVKFREHREETF